MNRLKLITFDATLTLLHFRIPPVQQYAKTARAFNIDVNEEKLKVSFKKQWLELNREQPNFGATTGLLYQEWWTEFVKRTFLGAGCRSNEESLTLVASQLIKLFGTKDFWCVSEHTPEMLSTLKRNHFHLGVISNFDERLITVLSEVGLNKFFDFVLCSYVVKCMKPNREIFDLALKHYDFSISPAEALHVGDDVELDYLGAKKAGWSAIILRNDKNREKLSTIDDNDVVDDLKYLPHILKI